MDKKIVNWFEVHEPKPHLDSNLKTDNQEIIDDDRLVGIEVELENSNVKMRNKSTVWVAHNDGSLRNTGLEWITHPIRARDAPAALHDLFSGGANQCSFTPRTSIHVHFNCCDLTKDQVLDILMLYLHFERQLYGYVGKNRVKNIYCVPINDTTLARSILVNRFDVSVGRWKKYTGLNLLPLRDKGTMEFRQMHGTSNTTKVAVWIRLIDRLFQFVLKSNSGEIRKRLSNTWTVDDLTQLGKDVFLDDWKYLSTTPTMYDAFSAKQCFITGKEANKIDLQTYHTSPFATFKAGV